MDNAVSYSRSWKEIKDGGGYSSSLSLSQASDSDTRASTLSLESDEASYKSPGGQQGRSRTAKHPAHQLSSARRPGQGLSRDTIPEDQELTKGSVRAQQQLPKPSVSKPSAPPSTGRHRSSPEVGRVGKVPTQSARRSPGVVKPAIVLKTSGRPTSGKRMLPSTPGKKASLTGGKLASKKQNQDGSLRSGTGPAQGKAALSQDAKTERFLVLMDSILEMPIADNEELFKFVAADAGVKWSLLGRYLDVSDEDIEEIKQKYHFDNERCMQMIVKWLGSKELRPTYAKLACALVNVLQYDKVRGLKELIPQNSYVRDEHLGMHVLQLPLGEASLAALVAEMNRESEGGRTGAEVVIRRVSSDEFPPEGLVFSVMSLGEGSRGLKMLEYVLKAASRDDVKEVVVSLRYLST